MQRGRARMIAARPMMRTASLRNHAHPKREEGRLLQDLSIQRQAFRSALVRVPRGGLQLRLNSVSVDVHLLG